MYLVRIGLLWVVGPLNLGGARDVRHPMHFVLIGGYEMLGWIAGTSKLATVHTLEQLSIRMSSTDTAESRPQRHPGLFTPAGTTQERAGILSQ